jgi:hypothetical protein
MKISKANKIILVLGAVFVIFTIAAAFILKTGQNTAPKEVELISDYKVTQNDSENLVESKQAGFSASFPADWIIKNFGTKITFSNAEIKLEVGKSASEMIEENNLCSGTLEIKKYTASDNKDITALSSLISQVQSGEKGQDRNYAYTLAEINGRTFLKTTFTKDGVPVYISAKAIVGGNIYDLDSGLFFYQECEQAFDTMLESVKIK